MTSVRDAVAKRQELTPEEATIEEVRADIARHTGWFKRVVPRHVDPEQYVALCLGVISRGDQYLKRALIESPQTFMWAASECARMGLVPGETYHFVGFRNTVRAEDGGRDVKVYQVVGIVDYKGELDMIYRSGGVKSVHCHVVRAGDTFRWVPGEMDRPYHRIHSPEGSMQEGLADDAERGPITGVYAYAVFLNGGISQPVVMSRSSIAAVRAYAKTDKFWGPKDALYDQSKELLATKDMVRKTAIHKLFDGVPHSAEYLMEQMRVAAEVARMPAELRPRMEPPAIEEGSPLPVAEMAGDEPEPPAAPEDRDHVNRRLAALFRRAEMGASDQGDQRRAVITGLLGLPDLVKIPSLTDEQAALAAEHLQATLMRWQEEGSDVPGELRAYASAVARDIIAGKQQ